MLANADNLPQKRRDKQTIKGNQPKKETRRRLLRKTAKPVHDLSCDWLSAHWLDGLAWRLGLDLLGSICAVGDGAMKIADCFLQPIGHVLPIRRCGVVTGNQHIINAIFCQW